MDTAPAWIAALGLRSESNTIWTWFAVTVVLTTSGPLPNESRGVSVTAWMYGRLVASVWMISVSSTAVCSGPWASTSRTTTRPGCESST
jgi:hypothetical protein